MSGLTEREKEVVNLLAQGKSPYMIACQLIVTRSTVYTHLRRACEKTGTSSHIELAVGAARQSVQNKS